MMPIPTIGTPLPRKKVRVFAGALLDPCDIAQPHQIAIHHRARAPVGRSLARCTEAARDAHRELTVDRIQAACRQFQVLGAQRILDIADRQPACRQLAAIQPDAHREGLAAANTHPGHAIQHREPIDQIAPSHSRTAPGTVMRSLTRFSHMITSSLLSTFWISGGSASSGRSSSTVETRSRMSFAAPSMSRSTSNCTVIAERPSSLTRLDEADALDAGDAVFDHLGDRGSRPHWRPRPDTGFRRKPPGDRCPGIRATAGGRTTPGRTRSAATTAPSQRPAG